MDTNQLWKDRLNQHIKLTSRYLKLIFNDHLAFALIFFIAAFAFFYQNFLQTVPPDFPVAWIMAIVLGLLVTTRSIRTFFKEADEVYLLAVENRMRPYIIKSFIYSLVGRSYTIALALFALTPLYLAIFQDKSIRDILIIFILLLLLQSANFTSSWFAQKTRDKSHHLLDLFSRGIVNILFIYFLVTEAYLLSAVAGIVSLGIVGVNYYYIHLKNSFPWDLLIEKEEARQQLFYRIANMSTDVPQLKQKPKKRHQLVRLATRWIKYDQRNTFLLLYTITFVRSRDYLGLFLRLSILGIFLIYWIPLFWGKIVFGLLILFLSGFQFVSIYNHHQSLDWIRLYPLSSELRKKSVHQLILLLMGIQILILFPFFIWLDELGNALIFLAIAIVFTVLFESFYLKGRIKKIEAN